MLQQAIALFQAGQVFDARSLCRKILLRKPEDAGALHLLGMIEIKRNDLLAALELFERAISSNPQNPSFFNSRGNTQMRLERIEDALASYEQALKISSDNAFLLVNRANALQRLGRLEEALETYERAIALDPNDTDALVNRAKTYQSLKRWDRAIAGYDRVLEIDPDYPCVLGERLRCKMSICDWDGLPEARVRIATGIAAGKNASQPFSALGFSLPASLQRRCAAIFAQALFPANELLPPFERRHAHDRIRLGYFSADFFDHVVAHQIAELFERHDRAKFELIGFSLRQPSADAMTGRLAQAFDRLIDVCALPDREAASLARSLEIDIAIDLNGFTLGGRGGIFAMRAAPIQVNYLGYPGTLAADYIDYIIADAMPIPEGRERDYAEKICRLPDTFFVTQSSRSIAKRIFTRAECDLPAEGFVFCCFNDSSKLTPEIFDVWMRLLQKVEGSVLWLRQLSAAAIANLKREAQARGVEPERIVFAAFLSNAEEHLGRLKLGDLFLDTLPYNAHATAADALWSGVPVLTCLGETFQGRVAASLLKAIGLPELITNDLNEYEVLALEIAAHPQKLAALKRKLAANRAASPLFDAARFTRHIEAAYLAMWERHQAGLTPAHIGIPPGSAPMLN